MGNRFGRQQKRKAIETRKQLEYLKGRHCEMLALLSSFVLSLSEQDFDYVCQADIGDRTVVYRDGVHISLNRLKSLFLDRT